MRYRKRGPRKKHNGNAMIYKQVPIVAHFSQFTDKPGYVEIDFVEHNGGVSSGVFAITGTYTDIFSGWVVRAAGLGRNENSVSSIDKIAQTRIFHRVFHYHPDNDRSILKVLFERMKRKIKKIFKSLDMIELRQEVNKILQILYDIQLMRSRKKIMI